MSLSSQLNNKQIEESPPLIHAGWIGIYNELWCPRVRIEREW
jgi:hypothetical protein